MRESPGPVEAPPFSTFAPSNTAPGPARSIPYPESPGDTPFERTPEMPMRPAGPDPMIPMVNEALRSSAPPASPEAAAEELTYRQKYGEAVQAIGDLNKRLEDRDRHWQEQLEDLKFRQALAAPAAHRPAALPDIPNELAQQPMTFGEFHQALNRFIPSFQADTEARAIRSTWGVSPAQEATILQTYPEILQRPDPDRTRLIQQAAVRLFPPQREAAPAPASPSPVAAGAPSETRQMRPAASPIPHVETSSAPTVGDVQPVSRVAELNKRYAELSRTPSRETDQARRERFVELRRVHDEINSNLGITAEVMKNSAYKQSA